VGLFPLLKNSKNYYTYTTEYNKVNQKMDNMNPATKIIGLAAKASGILTLPILLIGLFFWVFSQGSFDNVWEKLNQVSGNQTFILLLVAIILTFSLIFGLAWLWYSLEDKKLNQNNALSLKVPPSIPSDSDESQKKTSVSSPEKP
jgi:hypothetical protein